MIRIIAVFALAFSAFLVAPQKTHAQFRLSTNVQSGGCIGGGGAGGLSLSPLASREIVERREVIQQPLLVPILLQSGCLNLGSGVQRSVLDVGCPNVGGLSFGGLSSGGYGRSLNSFGGLNVDVRNRGLLSRSNVNLRLGDVGGFGGLNVRSRSGLLGRSGVDVNIGGRGGLGSLGLGGGLTGLFAPSAEQTAFRFGRPAINVDVRSGGLLGLLRGSRTRVLIN